MNLAFLPGFVNTSMNQQSYPEWVTAWMEAHNTDSKYEVCVISGGYYLYERSPAKGMSHKYVGTLKEDGLRERRPRRKKDPQPNPRLSIENTTVREYGFSKAVLDLLPASWKSSLRGDCMPVIRMIIAECSPTSFLLDVFPDKDTRRRRYIGSHKLKLDHLLPVSLSELYDKLHTICLVQDDSRTYIANCTPAQLDYCRSLNISLEEVSWPVK